MLFSDERTHNQEQRSSARRGCEYRTCKGASTESRRTAEGVCADRRCIRVERRRKGLTLVPAPALRDFQSLCSRAGLPRGADAPRSCVGVRTLVGEKTIFAMHKRTPKKSGGRQPAVGVGNAPATPIPHTVANTRLVPKHEGRSSARRGRGKHVCADASVLVRGTAEGVCADRRCIRVV
jgi:IS5 family transposase